jgi:REP element-mobilizing transposase RayT
MPSKKNTDTADAKAERPAMRTLHIRIRDKHATSLRARAFDVNQVWNFCNALSINNLKTASARHARNPFSEPMARCYCKQLFWHRAYFVGRVGGATPETVRAYVNAQGTEEHVRRAALKDRTRASA